MLPGPTVLARANLFVQLVLGIALFAGTYLSARKRNYRAHCALMRVAVPVQILSVIVVMTPSLIAHMNEQPGAAFAAELLLHHTLGLIVIALWIYFNLVMMRKIKRSSRLAPLMRLAFACWSITLLGGVWIYILTRL